MSVLKEKKMKIIRTDNELLEQGLYRILNNSIFRYQNFARGFDIIDNQELFLSKPSQLNDPFDCYEGLINFKMNKEIEYKYSDKQQSPGFLLWQVTMLWQRTVKRELDGLDLTHIQFVLLSVLNHLSKTKAIITQVDIAENSKVDRMMTSKVLRALEEKGFILREKHPTDTRALTLTLKKEGFNVLKKAIPLVENIDLKFFGVSEKNICEDLILLLQQNA